MRYIYKVRDLNACDPEGDPKYYAHLPNAVADVLGRLASYPFDSDVGTYMRDPNKLLRHVNEYLDLNLPGSYFTTYTLFGAVKIEAHPLRGDE